MSAPTRIEARFADLKAQGRAAFVTFVTAGDPGYDTSLEILRALPAAGADIIESEANAGGRMVVAGDGALAGVVGSQSKQPVAVKMFV